MQNIPEILSYEFNHYKVEIEIDFYIRGKQELTWHVTVSFLTKTNKLIKTLYFNKKNRHLKNTLIEVYWEANNDQILRYGLENIHLDRQMLSNDHYIDIIYPMIQRLRTSRNNTMTDLEKRIVFQNTKYV
jgi:hypothetical protein